VTRRSALGTFRAAGEDDAGRLVGGLVLGADEDLTRETTEAFRAAGTAHLLAVSGQNVALLPPRSASWSGSQAADAPRRRSSASLR
jgi:predicted membrane metal-binding protein